MNPLIVSFLQDDASAGMRSLQFAIEIKLNLPKSMERTLAVVRGLTIFMSYTGPVHVSWDINFFTLEKTGQ